MFMQRDLITLLIGCVLCWGCGMTPKAPGEEAMQSVPTVTASVGLKVITQPILRKNVDELNRYLAIYNDLSPLSEYAIDSLKLPKNISDSLTINDSTDKPGNVTGFSVIQYYAGAIDEILKKVLNDKNIVRYDLSKIVPGMGVARSDDGRLYSLSIDEKTGGSYRSQLSWMHYRTPNGQIFNFEPAQFSGEEEGVLNPDGYDRIITLDTKEGVKYLLFGSVMGCNTCFGEYVDLMKFDRKGNVAKDFAYSISTRFSMEDNDSVIRYNTKNHSIAVNYTTDDLAPDCSCSKDEEPEDEQTVSDATQETEFKPEYGKTCSCVFVYNGKTFVLSDKKLRRN